MSKKHSNKIEITLYTNVCLGMFETALKDDLVAIYDVCEVGEPIDVHHHYYDFSCGEQFIIDNDLLDMTLKQILAIFKADKNGVDMYTDVDERQKKCTLKGKTNDCSIKNQ